MVVIRSSDANEIVSSLERASVGTVQYIQLLSTSGGSDALDAGVGDLPVEIVLIDPVRQCSQLYNFASLLDRHPVRVVVPVKPGFSKAVKVAVSLNFQVRLDLDQPDQNLVDEL